MAAINPKSSGGDPALCLERSRPVAPAFPPGRGEMQRDERARASADEQRQAWIARILQGPEADMQHDQPIGAIDAHMDRLPHGRTQEGEPEIMAGRRQYEQDQQGEHAEGDEGQAAEFARGHIGCK